MSASYSAATRTVTAADQLSEPFKPGDVGKSVSMVIGGRVCSSRVARYVSGTAVILHQSASLPATDGAVTTLTLHDDQ